MLSQKIGKFFQIMRQGGLSEALAEAKTYLLYRRAINAHRKHLALQIASEHQWRVGYGPFAGMQISPVAWWDQTDLASKILGFYELEVLNVLSQVDRSRYRFFVDLGAADGYYAIGALRAGLFQKAFCFEMSERGREVVRANAALNDVSESVAVFGYADARFYESLPEVQLSAAVILIDIEGGEFDLLTDELLARLKNAMLVIELHEFMVDDGAVKLQALVDRLKRVYRLRWLTTGARDLSAFESLGALNDTDRWLLCSESRTQRMKWVVCEPLAV